MTPIYAIFAASNEGQGHARITAPIA